MSSSLFPQDVTVTRCRPIVHTNVFKSDSSLSVVDINYSFTRACNALASLITSIESLESPPFWYNLSDNGTGSVCELLKLEDCVCLSLLKICGLIRQKKVNEKMIVSIVIYQWISFISQYLKLVSIMLALLVIIKSQGGT